MGELIRYGGDVTDDTFPPECRERHPKRSAMRCVLEAGHEGEHTTLGHGPVGSDRQWDSWPNHVASSDLVNDREFDRALFERKPEGGA